jgi:DNA helicase-4
VYKRYQEHLASSSLIDFNDIIRRAEQVLDCGHELKDIKYVLIDEFQDIFLRGAQFIESLPRSTDHAKFVAVGDYLQSIYRLSGSDVSVMTSFDDYFGRHEVRMLPETFCFDQMVGSVASRLVLKNEAQIKKKVIAKIRDNSKSVILWPPQKDSVSLPESIAQHIAPAKSRKKRRSSYWLDITSTGLNWVLLNCKHNGLI